MKKMAKIVISILLGIFIVNLAFARDLSNVEFSMDDASSIKYDAVVENTEALTSSGKEHSEKYYANYGTKIPDDYNYIYKDVTGLEHKMTINKDALYNNIIWDKTHRVADLNEPLNYDAYFGVDVSKHNGDIDWVKVKESGIDFAFIRIVYRGYGKKGTLKEDELAVKNLKNAKAAGHMIGAYVFSQSINEDETIEEAKLAVKILNDNKITLDLPLVYDPETIRNDIARTDDINGEVFTNNAITFCEYIKVYGITPAIYSNMIWEDYYFDMSKLKDYEIWYADYEDFPQTPYRYKYWQFSECGKVRGITKDNNYVDLNVMLKKRLE